MNLTTEQEQAARLFQKGGNVSVQAIPGAGKTALLIRSCLLAPKPCVILAYNVQLASDIKRAIAEADMSVDVSCFTFHSLCTRTLAPARDDIGILQAVQAARGGTLQPREVPEARRVLIDESQDVRELYIQLLDVLGLCAPHVPTMVVGDRMQLIYDFDPDFPATEDTLLNPEHAFYGNEPWNKLVLSQSHRLTLPMAMLTHSMFGTAIHSTRDGQPVDVRVGNVFNLYELIRDITEEEDSHTNVMILVDRKKSNRALCLLLNKLSENGCNVHVHGIDSEDPSATDGKLRCSTWWAAKGMQTHTVICIVPRFTPRNPLYVALTRAYNRLVVVLDEKEVHYKLCEAIMSIPSHMVILNAKSRRIVSNTAGGVSEDSFDQELRSKGDTQLRPLDNWRAPRNIVNLFTTCDVSPAMYTEDFESDTGVVMPGGLEDTSHVTLRLALVAAEFEATGRIRGMEDILQPMKLDPNSYVVAVRCGLASRYISRNRPASDVLLSHDLMNLATASYARLKQRREQHYPQHTVDFAIISLAVISWDSYDHVMRQLLPVTEWCHKDHVLRAIEVARNTFPTECTGTQDYDVRSRVCHQGIVLTVRTHAVDATGNYVAAWGEDFDSPSHDTMTQCALKAAMHTNRTCILVDLFKGWVKRIVVEDPAKIVAMVE
jgi:hypothetical protein